MLLIHEILHRSLLLCSSNTDTGDRSGVSLTFAVKVVDMGFVHQQPRTVEVRHFVQRSTQSSSSSMTATRPKYDSMTLATGSCQRRPVAVEHLHREPGRRPETSSSFGELPRQ